MSSRNFVNIPLWAVLLSLSDFLQIRNHISKERIPDLPNDSIVNTEIIMDYSVSKTSYSVPIN